jgi:hypothetical protein
VVGTSRASAAGTPSSWVEFTDVEQFQIDL